MATFPDVIHRLPEADVSFRGITLRLLQGSTASAIFVEASEDARVPEHSHGAQWGIVVDGELRLTIGAETRTLRRGDEYFIPPGVKHAASLKGGTRVIDFFDVPDRYNPKR